MGPTILGGGAGFLSPQSIEITLIDPKENKYSDPAAFSKNDGKKIQIVHELF